MPTVFGLDIANIVNDALTQAGGLLPMSFTRNIVIEDDLTSDDLTASTQGQQSGGAFGEGFSLDFAKTQTQNTLTFAGQGIITTKEVFVDDSTHSSVMTMISVMGASTFPYVPMEFDVVEVDGSRYVLEELIKLDTANALYKFRATKGME